MSGKYILDENKQAVLEPDLMKWAMWYETADRTVAITEVAGVSVSTIFLGLDFNFVGGEPRLFETCIFTDTPAIKYLNGQLHRTKTWKEAEQMHKDALVCVQRALAKSLGTNLSG